MTVEENVIRCDGYCCPSVDKLDIPFDSFRVSADWTFEVRRWFEDRGWRTVDAGDGKRRADLCPQHTVSYDLTSR
jgi:hypothetical protein